MYSTYSYDGFKAVWMVVRLNFRQINPFWHKADFNQKKNKFRKLNGISNNPTSRFYMKRKVKKAYINFDYDI